MHSDKFNTQTIKTSCKTVYKAIADKRIKDAFDLLAPLVKETHNSDLIDTHYNLEFNYKSMLKFMVEGISDPERQKIYHQQVNEIYLLVDKVTDFLLTKYSSEIYFDKKRSLAAISLEEVINNYQITIANWELRKLADPDAVLSKTEQEDAFNVFYFLWTKLDKQETDRTALTALLNNKQVPWYHSALFTSAIFLALLQHYNSELISLLIELSEHSESQVSVRAIVGLLMVLYKYDDRIKNDPAISPRIYLLTENTKLTGLMKSIIIQLIRTRETEKISKKMTNEILPEVVKIHPKIKDKLDLENMISDKFLEDKNPEWEDVFKDSPDLLGKLEEISQWQMEGADVFLTTFKMLKHFPFFNTIPNWLLPFHLNHVAIREALAHEKDFFQSKDLLDSLAASRFLCNSDKFSLILSVQHMPSMQKEMMGQMFSAELQQMADIQKDENALNANQFKLAISNQFIQDLYRLFKVYPQKHHFEDIFSWNMSFHKKWFFNSLLSEKENLIHIGEYFFKKNYFSESIEIYLTLYAQGKPSQEVTQKIAYCYQQLEDYEKALTFYLRADLFDSQSAWNKKKVALCYRHLKNPLKALEFYKQAEKIASDNLHTQASIGHCLLELKNYEEALKYYFKVEYLDNNNTKVWRPIAWCSFVLGKFQQAEKYYNKLIVGDKNKHDLMNLGHVLWCKGQRTEALNLYQKSIQSPNNSLALFIESFYTDIDVLIENGIKKEDLPIMLDQICYSIES